MSHVNYVNCVYTTQGDYVCQRNKNLDAFYHKTIVDDGITYPNQHTNQNQKNGKTVMEGFNNAVEDGKTKFDNQINANNIKKIETSCFGQSKQVNETSCKEALVTLYGSRCKNIPFNCTNTNNRQTRIDNTRQLQGVNNKGNNKQAPPCVNNAYDTNINTVYDNIVKTKSVDKDMLMKTLVC